jgi:hypothetical protein
LYVSYLKIALDKLEISYRSLYYLTTKTLEIVVGLKAKLSPYLIKHQVMKGYKGVVV